MKTPLHIDSSPHINAGSSVEKIMQHVLLALSPVVIFAIYAYGLAVLLLLVVSILSCVLSEHFFNRLSTKNQSLQDYSIIVTAVIYALTLPPGLALWMAALGGFVCVALGKFIFGGLGANPFNPALVGRAFLQAAFPVAMTNWTPAFSADRFVSLPTSTLAWPFGKPIYDQISMATPLAAKKFEQIDTGVYELALGLTSGSAGETCAVLLLAGAGYLLWKKILKWQIPLGIFTAVILLTGMFNLIQPDVTPSPLFMLFSGGLMLGALFMATDPVASPITAWGCFVYGIIIGMLIVIIRLWGGLPEGVMYAILFANALSPHIDRLIQPKVFDEKS